jgi:hypothetical protein
MGSLARARYLVHLNKAVRALTQRVQFVRVTFNTPGHRGAAFCVCPHAVLAYGDRVDLGNARRVGAGMVGARSYSQIVYGSCMAGNLGTYA